MVSNTLLELRSSWAQALASLNPVEEGKVALLLQLCGQQPLHEFDGGSVASHAARDVVASILPLISFLNKSGGQRVDLVMPEVVRQLPLVAASWNDPVSDPDALERLFEDLFTSLRSLLANQDVQASWRRALSAAVAELLKGLLQTVLRMRKDEPAATVVAGTVPAPSPAAAAPTSPLSAAAPAQILLRTLTRSQAFAAGSGLPLLSTDAHALLSWMAESVLPPGGRLPSTGPVTPPPGSRAAVGAAAAADEKVLLLMAQLVRTMLAAARQQQQRPFISVGGAAAPPAALTADDAAPGDVAAHQELIARERVLLTTLLTWSMGQVRSVLTKLLQPAVGVEALSSMLLTGKQPATAAPQPSAGVTRAAARLAASAMYGLLLRAGSVGAASVAAAATGSAGGTAAAVAAAAAAPSGVLADAARGQLRDVISMLLDMSEACVSAALEIGPQVAASDKMLDTAAYILEDCSSLIIIAAREAAAALLTSTASNGGSSGSASGASPTPAPPRASATATAAALDVGTVFSRLKAILLAAAALVRPVHEQPPTEDTNGNPAAADSAAAWRRFWAWDISRPLTASYASNVGRVAGWGAQRLCCNVAEALACGLAASYHTGARAYVRALLLLPLSLPDAAAPAAGNEAQVLSLAMGRLFVLLRGEEQLARSMVPLLTDVLGQPAGSGAGVSLQASVVQTLAAMAASSVRAERGTTWAYSQITDVLLRLLLDARQPGAPAAGLVAGAAGPGAGALCAGLLSLAKSMRGAVPAARRDLRNRLLVQFGELGLRAGGPGGGAGVVSELGQLLPAVAEACEGLEGGLAFGHDSSASRFSLHDLAAQQQQQQRNGGPGGHKTDLQLVKLLRNLWLTCALFGLCRGQSAPPPQQAAAGRIAAVTPVLLLGEAPTSEVDMAEQLKAELGERLRLAGPAASAPARLRASLQATLGVSPGGTPQPPPDAFKQAYLLTVATVELCRAKYAPLVADGESSPISVALTYLQSADPQSADAAWYGAVAEKAFATYLARLQEEAAAAAMTTPSSSCQPPLFAVPTSVSASFTSACGAAPDDSHRRASTFPGDHGPRYAGLPDGVPPTAVQPSAWPGDGVSLSNNSADSDEDGANGVNGTAGGASAGASGGAANVYERCLEGLAVTLIRHLGAAGGHEEGVAPQAAIVADRLLNRLRRAYPPIYWSQACVAALLRELETEEGLDRPLSEVHSNGSSGSSRGAGATSASAGGGGGGGTVWGWLRSWVHAAAVAAPSRTEALLHQFLGQSSIAAFTLGSLSSFSSSSSSSSASLSAAAPSAEQRVHAAARRRAADLLAICTEARRRGAGGMGGAGADDATMAALCMKLFYTGAIVGVQYTAGGASASPAAVAEVALAALEEGLAAAHHNVRLLEQRYLGAAAFLAREADEEAEAALVSSAAHAVCYRVLQGLCMAPLRRFTPDMMSLAVFAWTWITTAGPTWLVPLVSRTGAAWAQTVDRGMGLFSGPWVASEHDGAEGDAAAEGGGDGNGDVGCSEAESELLSTLASHHQWIGFLYEMWCSAGDRTDAEQRALASVYDRLLHHSLSAPERLSTHPAAAAPLFRLLRLALTYCLHCARLRPAGAPCPPPQALLYDRLVRAGLLWFAHSPGFTARMSQRQAEEQHAAVADFAALLASAGAWPAVTAAPVYDKSKHGPSAVDAATWASHPPVSAAVWGPAAKGLRTADAVALLQVLCRAEVARLRVWARPLVQPGAAGEPPLVLSEAHVKTAWKVSPQLAVSIVQRCPPPPTSSEPHRTLEALLIASAADPRVQALPQAALVLATPEAARRDAPYLAALATWAPAGAVEGLELMSGAAQLHAGIKAYALRCLHAAPPAKVAFFLPQLVQALRSDADGATSRFLLSTAASDDLFAHQLIWALATEERPPPEAFNPEVKRSGWQPPQETGLWQPAAQLKAAVLGALSPPRAAFWEAEERYFDQVTSISGILKKLEPDERRAKIRSELSRISPSRSDLYVPTNPDCRVLAHLPESGTPMQSAAKVPILVAFQVFQQPQPQQPQPQQQSPPDTAAPLPPPLSRTLACIFKVGDDVRQDVLALQVISLLRSAFQTAGLDLYLRPYGCIPTGYERGIIEVVPHTKSRAAMGELSDRGLHEIFVSQFGPPGSARFEDARRNFITSQAGYAVASFLLQAKDRHNGNLLVDCEGHLVHIDFGFILDISPGGNLGFESAAFKLSHEMAQLLDPGGCRNSEHFRRFEELCVRGYLAARTVAEPIIATVALMAASGLPCFGYGRPLANLRKRFHLEMSDGAAAAFMRGAIADAYQKWTTGFYDYIQALQNRIPY
ncbi:hypothetical protein Agub_g5805 [Astrephomene gubernaculifera]|uniref:1-phosphatidylinositol 4-kinase n=1 Tax=Astrephomene gubernaculifera TaxID=47775 RepID=A0AAD3DMC3_9CHLO|nr:hypothetical protein Agub_g5805 [Astrephomene gubernaculifera]